MNKFKSIVLLLLALTISHTVATPCYGTDEAVVEQPIAEEEEIILQICQLTYQSRSNPICEPEPAGSDPTQNPVCQIVPPEVGIAMLNHFRNTVSQPDFVLDEINYEENGGCQGCVLHLWDQPNFEGNTHTVEFDQSLGTKIRTSDFWNEEALSFRVTCNL